MEIKKVYVKKRLEFGKQCILNDSEPLLDVAIPPNPAEIYNFITRSQCHVSPQTSKQLAAHEAQTIERVTKSSGMNHFEGGWPKEINPTDAETTTRFRRRVEKDDHWAPKLHNLFEVMEEGILQNGAINIYQHYFDDMVPTTLVQPISLRAINLYSDPARPRRPVNDISVSPEGRRIVVSYCFLDFARRSDYSNTVYVWQVDNPNEPYMALEPFCPCVACEYNPRDPSVLASGLMTGQVCNWDLRMSEKPVQYSDRLYSHRSFANAVKWVPTKSNTDFFSTSLDGCAFWWDMRWLRQPTEKLMMDLEKPNEPSMDRTIGISCLNHGPMVGTKFLFGMDNGFIITGSRKAKTNAEKLATKFAAHSGPVIAADRNALNPMIFMSVGDWRVRIWAEDTREGNLVSTLYMQDIPTTGCWDKIRNSVFYVATDAGTLVAWDLLQKLRQPIFKLQLCNEKITTIAPYEEGSYIAVGNYNGTSYLIESSEFLKYFDRKDRAALSEYWERCSRLTKAVDARLREIKLIQKLSTEEDEKAATFAKAKEKKKAKLMETDQEQVKEWKKRIKSEMSSIQLTDAENKYYELVGQELLNYANESEPDLRPSGPTMMGLRKLDRKVKKADEKTEKETKKKNNKRISDASVSKRRSLLSRIRSFVKRSSTMATIPGKQVSSATVTPGLTERERSEKKKKKIIKFRVPVPCKKEICKPKVCCFRHKRGSSGKKKRKKLKRGTSLLTSPMLMDGSMTTASIRKLSVKKSSNLRALIRWQMLDLPAELVEEVERARREIREFAPSGTVSWKRQMTEKGEEEKRQLSDSERSRKTLTDVEDDRTEEEESSSTSEDRSSEKRLPIKERQGRKISFRPEPCRPVTKKSITEEFTEMIGIPMPKLFEEDAEKDDEEEKTYAKDVQAMQARVYPRISEFHTIE